MLCTLETKMHRPRANRLSISNTILALRHRLPSDLTAVGDDKNDRLGKGVGQFGATDYRQSE